MAAQEGKQNEESAPAVMTVFTWTLNSGRTRLKEALIEADGKREGSHVHM